MTNWDLARSLLKRHKVSYFNDKTVKGRSVKPYGQGSDKLFPILEALADKVTTSGGFGMWYGTYRCWFYNNSPKMLADCQLRALEILLLGND